ncbi:MAG: hypothetical protein R3A79_00015 [Nannocystaceae bacterium]
MSLENALVSCQRALLAHGLAHADPPAREHWERDRADQREFVEALLRGRSGNTAAVDRELKRAAVNVARGHHMVAALEELTRLAPAGDDVTIEVDIRDAVVEREVAGVGGELQLSPCSPRDVDATIPRIKRLEFDRDLKRSRARLVAQ